MVTTTTGINSKAISTIIYNHETKNLAISFQDKFYNYKNVPKAVASAFANAQSVGKYYHSDIKGVYDEA